MQIYFPIDIISATNIRRPTLMSDYGPILLIPECILELNVSSLKKFLESWFFMLGFAKAPGCNYAHQLLESDVAIAG
jgi:hypothetical protein